MQQLLGSIELDRPDITIQHYQCWSKPGSGLNLEFEAGVVGRSSFDLVIAKSIGTRVALFSYVRDLISAGKYVFIGTPVRGYSENEIILLKQLCTSVPVLLIQQTDDKVGSYSSLVSLLPTVSTCKVVEVPGHDHVYSDVILLKKIIESWYSQSGGQNTD